MPLALQQLLRLKADHDRAGEQLQEMIDAAAGDGDEIIVDCRSRFGADISPGYSAITWRGHVYVFPRLQQRLLAKALIERAEAFPDEPGVTLNWIARKVGSNANEFDVRKTLCGTGAKFKLHDALSPEHPLFHQPSRGRWRAFPPIQKTGKKPESKAQRNRKRL